METPRHGVESGREPVAPSFGTPALTEAFLRDVVAHDVQCLLDARRWDLIRRYYGTSATLEELKSVAQVRSRETVRKLIASGMTFLFEQLAARLPGRYTIEEVLRPKSIRMRLAEATRRQWQDGEYREARRRTSRRALQARWDDPEERARMVEGLKRRWDAPGHREWQRELTKARWAEGKFRDSISKNPERSEKLRQAAKRRWADAAFRARMAESMRARWRDADFRARMAEARERHE